MVPLAGRRTCGEGDGVDKTRPNSAYTSPCTSSKCSASRTSSSRTISRSSTARTARRRGCRARSSAGRPRRSTWCTSSASSCSCPARLVVAQLVLERLHLLHQVLALLHRHCIARAALHDGIGDDGGGRREADVDRVRASTACVRQLTACVRAKRELTSRSRLFEDRER